MKKMNVWRVAVVADQPSLTLVRWSIVETNFGTRHLVGFCLENHEGRVSTDIVRFDPDTLRCDTLSGRVYQLQGPSGHDEHGAYVWEYWTTVNGVENWSDVTDTMLAPEHPQDGESPKA